MNKHQENKKAWEEAYDYRNDYDKDLLKKVQSNKMPYLNENLKNEILQNELENKTVVQFCCNNGRELLTLGYHHNIHGIGFDIAKNMVQDANRNADKLKINVEFLERDIFEIEESFNNTADYLIITVGALCWFADLNRFFQKVASVLKKDGKLFLSDIHPISCMLAVPGDKNYDSNHPSKITNHYFTKKEWEEADGMGYMSVLEKSLPFYSYSYTMAEVLNSIIQNDLEILSLREYPNDIGEIFQDLDSLGIPLSMLIVAKKK